MKVKKMSEGYCDLCGEYCEGLIKGVCCVCDGELPDVLCDSCRERERSETYYD